MADEYEDYGKPCLVKVQTGRGQWAWGEATVYRKLRVETFERAVERYCYEVTPAGFDGPVRVRFEDVRLLPAPAPSAAPAA